MADLVKRTVMVDTYAWMTRTEDGPQHNLAHRGDEIEVSAKEAERGEGLNALGTGRVAARANAAAEEVGLQPDEVLRGYNVAELTAYVNQHPSQAEHVRDLELDRAESKQRTTVLTLVDQAIAARTDADEERAVAAENTSAAMEAARAAAMSAPTVPSGAGSAPTLP